MQCSPPPMKEHLKVPCPVPSASVSRLPVDTLRGAIGSLHPSPSGYQSEERPTLDELRAEWGRNGYLPAVHPAARRSSSGQGRVRDHTPQMQRTSSCRREKSDGPRLQLRSSPATPNRGSAAS